MSSEFEPNSAAPRRVWPPFAVAMAIFLFILCAPRPEGLSPVAQRLAAVVATMASLWVLQPIPIAATSLLPLVAFPILGIQAAKDVSQSYIDENVFLFLGGFIIALGIERWGLHRRIALHILHLIGSSPKRIVLGFMLASGFISMWISNTATTLLMLPIGSAILVSIGALLADGTEAAPMRRLEVSLLLGIAYASSIGGLTTLVGTPTNVAFLKAWSAAFPKAPQFSSGEWMAMFVPFGLAMLIAAWLLLTFRMPSLPGLSAVGRALFRQQIAELGPPTRAETAMMAIFLSAAFLWVFRVPIQLTASLSLPGWGPLAERFLLWLGAEPKLAATAMHDSTVAMTLAFLMFCIPARRDDAGRTHFLMDWGTAQTLPWDVVILFGGGFAIANAFSATGLSLWMGNLIASTVAGWHPVWVVMAVALLMTGLTEFTTNVATVYALTPILAAATVRLGLDPRLVLLPAAVSTSCAFMLPVGTPPNAIVMGTGRVTIPQMCRYGLLLNLIGVLLVTLITFSLIVPQLGIEITRLPDWATEPGAASP